MKGSIHAGPVKEPRDQQKLTVSRLTVRKVKYTVTRLLTLMKYRVSDKSISTTIAILHYYVCLSLVVVV